MNRRCRSERLALTGAHLRDAAQMQHHAADQLHVVVAQTQYAPRRFAYCRERLGQQRIDGLACGDALPERFGLVAGCASGQRLHLQLDALIFTADLLICLIRRSLRLPKMPVSMRLSMRRKSVVKIGSTGAATSAYPASPHQNRCGQDSSDSGKATQTPGSGASHARDAQRIEYRWVQSKGRLGRPRAL